MSKHNYSQYSNNKKNDNNSKVEETVELVTEQVVDEVTEAEPMAVETPAEIKMESKPVAVTGVVANCVKLNVRAKPIADADVLCVLDANSEMEINMAKSNKDWYYVSTAAGVDGYCMRKFINVNK